MVYVPTGDHFKIPQLTQKQPLPWIKINMLVSKSLVNIYLSLQLGEAEDENRTSREGRHLCLILSHVVHVHHLLMGGPEPPSAVLQELQEMRASGCTSRLQEENVTREQSIYEHTRLYFSLLSFIFVFFSCYTFCCYHYYYCCCCFTFITKCKA